jgi:hypothetical protein
MQHRLPKLWRNPRKPGASVREDDAKFSSSAATFPRDEEFAVIFGRFVSDGTERIKKYTRGSFVGLVHRLISRRHTVGFKRVWMLGASEEPIRCDP